VAGCVAPPRGCEWHLTQRHGAVHCRGGLTCSTTRPSCTTAMMSASLTVLRRWAITRHVRPWRAAATAAVTAASLVTSSADVASSSTRTCVDGAASGVRACDETLGVVGACTQRSAAQRSAAQRSAAQHSAAQRSAAQSAAAHLRVREQSARDCHALPLAAAELAAPLAHRRVQARGQPRCKRRHARCICCRLHLLGAGVGAAVPAASRRVGAHVGSRARTWTLTCCSAWVVYTEHAAPQAQRQYIEHQAASPRTVCCLRCCQTSAPAPA